MTKMGPAADKGKRTDKDENGVHHIGAEKKKLLQKMAKEHGTPVFVIDHEKIRRNYQEFKKYLPHVQVYYAVKANSHPDIVKTLFDTGCSFDVASMPEFMVVYENIKKMPKKNARTGSGTRSSMQIR
jgi:Diaminopimelate decarboxylase